MATKINENSLVIKILQFVSFVKLASKNVNLHTSINAYEEKKSKNETLHVFVTMYKLVQKVNKFIKLF